MEHFPKACVVFADFSEPMLEAVRERTLQQERAEVLKADFSTPGWIESVGDGRTFDVVVSGFAIHHQPNRRKRALYAEIFGILQAPGIFLNLEHVEPATRAVETVFEEFFVDHLCSFHAASGSVKTRAEIEAASYSRPDKKENILTPVDRQCRWLREIGFEDVDCYFKIFELALFGGRKVSTRCS